MTDLVKRLRDGLIEYPKRWSGDTHSDMGGSVDYDKTCALLDEAANRIEALEAKLAKAVEAVGDEMARVCNEYAKRDNMVAATAVHDAWLCVEATFAELTGGKDD